MCGLAVGTDADTQSLEVNDGLSSDRQHFRPAEQAMHTAPAFEHRSLRNLDTIEQLAEGFFLFVAVGLHVNKTGFWTEHDAQV